MKINKVLLVAPRLNIGGAETYVVTIAQALKARGLEVHVASGGGRLAAMLSAQGIKQHFVPVRWSSLLASKMLLRIVKKYGIELVHANSAAAGIAAVRLKRLYNIPVVYTAHGVFGHNPAEMTLNECDMIICVSEFVRRYALDKGFDERRLQTLYTGIDLNKFQPDETAGLKMRRNLNIPEGAFALALTARIKNLRNKGHADILEILRGCEAACDWHLLIIGSGKSLWRLKWLIWRWRLGSRVHCLGHQLNVAHYVNAVDAVVLPSKLETFGLALAEGMALEKAAVAYDVGGVTEVIDDGVTGYLAKAGNRRDLQAKLTLLARDRNKCRLMGRQGREFVRRNFLCDAMTDRLAELYDQLVTEAMRR